MPEPAEEPLAVRIETFQSSSSLDLQPLWQGPQADGHWGSALAHPWGQHHRPDWHRRGLIIWPRGGLTQELRLSLACPLAWRSRGVEAQARLVLRWWAEHAALEVDGRLVHQGDLFDTACRWPLPQTWWQGQPLQLRLQLRSPLHDDGALIHSRVELEPRDPADPTGVLAPTRAALQELQAAYADLPEPRQGQPCLHVLGHAHLDLAWLWPVADTWQAAERTFASVLALMERHGQLHFAHSTPALYAWLQQHRPALWARLQAAVNAGRFEPINGPWVETDCVLISSAALLRQFQLGQHHSRHTFPQLEHRLAWLPDSFGFGAGLPAIAAATGVRWFCTHKLAWNATNPFPHRLFRWRSRCGSTVLALMTAPIGSDGDPLAMETYRLQWQRATGVAEALWLPGVGDHGGGPTAEMLEQLELWDQQARHGAPLAPQRHGSLRSYLERLEPLASQLPIWRDELYLELHRGCATSRPDQKRHNRTLERLLREADLAAVLARSSPHTAAEASWTEALEDWRVLLFQQFHDILPGTSVPEVFDQAEPQWRAARRRARGRRDLALHTWLAPAAPPQANPAPQPWAVVQLQPLQAGPRTLRLPPGPWQLDGCALPLQPAGGGGSWLQLPPIAGVGALLLQRQAGGLPVAIEQPVQCQALEPGRWRLGNGLLSVELGGAGIEQISDAAGQPYLAAPVTLARYRDGGEFWDAWDLAADYREQPLPIQWQPGLEWVEQGPLCTQVCWRGHCGGSPLRLDGRLLAASPWFELVLRVDWQQRHELLRLELPLARPARRWAADTSGGVLERPADPLTPREASRWEVPAISWLASVAAAPGAGLGVLLDGPQGVCGGPDRLGVSLLRGPTWPDPAADNGLQRLRLGLAPCPAGWSEAGLPQWAQQFREPLWCRPLPAMPSVPAPGLPPLGPGLQLLSLRPEPTGRGASIAVQNLSAQRRRLDLGPGWRVLARLDGLDQPLESQPEPPDLQLAPWACGFWRITPAAVPATGGPQSS
jgi:alpha-mannosidase